MAIPRRGDAPQLKPMVPIVTPTGAVPGVVGSRMYRPPRRRSKIIPDERRLSLDAADYSAGVPTAEKPLRLDMNGDVLACVDASSAAARVYVRFNGEGGWMTFRDGAKWRGLPFDHVLVKFDDQPGGYVNLAWALSDDDETIDA